MQRQTGFTLIELLTAIALMTIMIAVLFARTSGLSSRAQVDLAGKQILSYVRETRQQAVSVKAITIAGSEVFPGYGLAFIDGDNSVTRFADCRADDDGDGYLTDADTWHNWSGVHSCGGGSDNVDTTNLRYGAYISDITVEKTQGSAPVSVSKVAIQFLRPEPTLWISYIAGGSSHVTSAGTVRITINDHTDSDSEVIRIDASGLVTLE